MNKTDLAAACAPKLGGKASAWAAIDVILDAIVRDVASGGKVGVTGFGTFSSDAAPARMGRNPITGEAVPIPARRVARFRPAQRFRAFVSAPETLPEDGLAVGRASEEKG